MINYETNLNLERLALEQEWLKHRPEKISAGGIITSPNGRAWYAYLLKRWVSADVTPDEIYKFGLAEVKRVQGHIEALQQQSGLSEDAFYRHLNDTGFFETNPKLVQQGFEHTKTLVYTNLPTLFNDAHPHPLTIEAGQNRQLDQTPGYNDNNTLYYTLFDKHYTK